jgi:3-deoxy-manno-octulosonate cytidylyltransferase (CMP-KDO synthetase)
MPFHVVIPARYASTRLPGKALADIAGRPMIEWVWRAATASGAASVVVATDDERIRAACAAIGADCEMTNVNCASGTDRIAAVAKSRTWPSDAVVVNLQGDEPLMPPALLGEVAAALRDHPAAAIASAVTPVWSMPEFLDPNCVKAVRDLEGFALYFGRAPLPWPRDHAPGGRPASFAGAWRHIGLYAYRVDALARLAAWEPTPLEKLEHLEQLRALEHGLRIYLWPTDRPPPGGVDTPEDLRRVNEILSGHQQ